MHDFKHTTYLLQIRYFCIEDVSYAIFRVEHTTIIYSYVNIIDFIHG